MTAYTLTLGSRDFNTRLYSLDKRVVVFSKEKADYYESLGYKLYKVDGKKV